MIFSLFLLFAFLFVGETLKSALQIPVPGSVLGLLLLFCVLLLRRGGPAHWSISADVILKNLALLFVPAGVGLIAYGDILLADFWGLALVLVFGTALIIVLVGLLAQFLLRKKAANHGS